MGARIDQFCEDLRVKLTSIDDGMNDLKAKVKGTAEHAQQDVRSHLDQVHRRIQQNNAKLAAAQAEMKNWAEEQKAATRDKVAEWKATRETKKLEHRADNAERYAAAAITVAAASLDEAEEAAMEAWLARAEADVAEAKQRA
jgi:hypothetical protein